MPVAFVFFAFGVLAAIAVTAFVVKRRASLTVSSPLKPRYRRDAAYKGNPERDGWDETSDPKPVQAHLEIDYQDGNGSWTKRFVRVGEFDNNLEGGILIGHCELRGARRTFRFDRIKQCVDLETGKSVENVQKYLNDIYSNSAETPVNYEESRSDA